jgi:hypothetical protein
MVMERAKQLFGCILGGVFLFSGVLSCATVPELNLLYRLPAKTDELQGKKVFMWFEDMRKEKDLLGRGAQREYKSFPGNISFSLARGNEPGFKMGPHDVPSLFKEVFERRLEHLGVEVAAKREKGQIEMGIVLKEFVLDLVDRKWVATMGYEARLVKDENVLATQMITGEAERLKVVGRGAADQVMGDIFTDLVNRLDVSRLFQQAGVL